MSGFMGRKVLVTWNGVPLKGIREKSASFNGDPIDYTSGEDDGWQLLGDGDEAAQNEVALNIAGVLKDETIRAAWLAGNRKGALVYTYPNGAVLSGDFVVAPYKETKPMKDAAVFEATLRSSGKPTYTAGT